MNISNFNGQFLLTIYLAIILPKIRDIQENTGSNLNINQSLKPDFYQFDIPFYDTLISNSIVPTWKLDLDATNSFTGNSDENIYTWTLGTGTVQTFQNEPIFENVDLSNFSPNQPFNIRLDVMTDGGNGCQSFQEQNLQFHNVNQECKVSIEVQDTSGINQLSAIPNANAASVTTTLNLNYGSKVIVEGAGFLLNDEMDDFSAKPGVPNYFGLIGNEANAIEPEKRMLSSMTPTIVEKDGKLFMVLGAPGGSTIITAVFQTFINVAEYDMDLKDAVHANRFHHQWLPDEIKIEEGCIDSLTQKALEAKGHKFNFVKRMAVIKAIRVLPDGKLHGVGDWRNPDDHAEGY